VDFKAMTINKTLKSREIVANSFVNVGLGKLFQTSEQPKIFFTLLIMVADPDPYSFSCGTSILQMFKLLFTFENV
jgi:hypothetical protein